MIAHEACSEPTQSCVSGSFHPLRPGTRIPVSNDAEELFAEMGKPGDLRRATIELIKISLC
jgi:hypothetical protein